MANEKLPKIPEEDSELAEIVRKMNMSNEEVTGYLKGCIAHNLHRYDETNSPQYLYSARYYIWELVVHYDKTIRELRKGEGTNG